MVTVPGKYLQGGSVLALQDRAIPMYNKVPPENVTNNGLVCPACSTFSGCKDQPRHAMKCSGDETQCFKFTRFLNRKESITGCASPWYCALRLLIGEIYRAKPEPVIIKNCTKASSTSSLPVENYLLCKQCRGDLDDKCENYAKCAPEHDACVTTISQTIYGGYKRNIQRTRRCGSSAECDTAGIITTAQKTISRSTTCCYYDNCIPPLPTCKYLRCLKTTYLNMDPCPRVWQKVPNPLNTNTKF
ncbi:uncharacterized protein LOC122926387 [Bufo gargarizans]|uniref:uncharacterized protein LOC122926387 n=1 Tax=Bufo gargarizans TaxID=30331 RepID=UPI001CF35476|nr:uncharacterized protein LOC122926387 [Bufo gargarizans]